MHFLAEFLVQYEIMDDVQFDEAMKRENPIIEEIAEIGEEKKRRRVAENAEQARRNEEERIKREQKPTTADFENHDDPLSPEENTNPDDTENGEDATNDR